MSVSFILVCLFQVLFLFFEPHNFKLHLLTTLICSKLLSCELHQQPWRILKFAPEALEMRRRGGLLSCCDWGQFRGSCLRFNINVAPKIQLGMWNCTQIKDKKMFESWYQQARAWMLSHHFQIRGTFCVCPSLWWPWSIEEWCSSNFFLNNIKKKNWAIMVVMTLPYDHKMKIYVQDEVSGSCRETFCSKLNRVTFFGLFISLLQKRRRKNGIWQKTHFSKIGCKKISLEPIGFERWMYLDKTGSTVFRRTVIYSSITQFFP